jgi:hypothetical protein
MGLREKSGYFGSGNLMQASDYSKEYSYSETKKRKVEFPLDI